MKVTCFTCRRRKLRSEFPSMAARRCNDCVHRVNSATCLHCGGPAGLNVDNNPRMYCLRDECQREKASAIRRGKRKPLPKTWVCPVCLRRKPLDTDNFNPVVRGEGGEVVYFHSYCKPCQYADKRDRYSTDLDAQRRARERSASRRAEIRRLRREDPVLDAQLRRQACERSRRERQRGDVVAEVPRSTAGGGRLPSAPLLAAVDAALARREATRVDAWRLFTVSDRAMRWWADGHDVDFDTADRVLLELDLLWFDVWDEDQPGRDKARELFEGVAA